MADKIDIPSFQIAASKMRANGNAYFKLFEKHVPVGYGENSTILLYKIDNMSCIAKIMDMNNSSKYIVVTNDATSAALRIVLNKSINVNYLKDFDFEKNDMKFDCIIMNPPYNRGLHIKILDEAIKHVKNTGIIISLQPVVKWQESLLFDTSIPVDNTCVLERYAMDESSKLFNSHQRCDLGLVSIGKVSCTLVDNIDTLQKMKTKLKQAISTAGLLVDKLEDDYKDFPVNFGYGVTIAGNGGHGKACYRLTGIDETKATRREKIGHCARYNAKDKTEQHLIYSFYNNKLIRFIAKEFGFGGIPYKILPFATGFIDENGNTPLDEEWSFEKLAKWFELDYNDLVVVRK